MKVKEMVRDNKVKWAIACVIIGLVFAVGITLVSCSGIASVGGIGANQAVADAAGGVVEDVDSPEAETEPIGQEAHDDTRRLIRELIRTPSLFLKIQLDACG